MRLGDESGDNVRTVTRSCSAWGYEMRRSLMKNIRWKGLTRLII